jgi:hypothetical protein
MLVIVHQDVRKHGRTGKNSREDGNQICHERGGAVMITLIAGCLKGYRRLIVRARYEGLTSYCSGTNQSFVVTRIPTLTAFVTYVPHVFTYVRQSRHCLLLGQADTPDWARLSVIGSLAHKMLFHLFSLLLMQHVERRWRVALVINRAYHDEIW